MEYNPSNANTLGFPSEFVSPKIKESKEWLLSFCRTAYNEYLALPMGSIGMRSRDRDELVKAYARGEQPIDKYKKILRQDEDVSFIGLAVDWSILPIIKAKRQVALGLVGKQNYEISVDPIDPLAKNELQDKVLQLRGKLLARMVAQQQGNQELANSPALMLEPNDPDDFDGLEVMSTSLRHKTAMEAEQVCELVASQNNWDLIRNLYLESLVDYGVACLKDETDGYFVKIRNVDMRRVFINYCTSPDFSDLKYIGEVRLIPVSQLQVASQGQISEEDIKEIYQKSLNANWGIPSYAASSFTGGYTDWWNKAKIAVADFEMLSCDEITREERINRAGNLVYSGARDVNNPQKSKLVKKKVESVYRIKWIIGTEFAYDYGRQYDIKRDPKNISNAKLSYHLVTCSGFHDMRVRSRMDDVIPVADNIQLAYYKMQDALNSAIPKGFAVDLDKLEGVTMAIGQKELNNFELTKLFKQKGIGIYRGKGVDGKDSGIPFTELANGVNDAIPQFMEAIRSYFELANNILGLNDVTDSSTPNAKTLNGVAQMAQMGTNNALSDIYFADEQLANSVFESVIIRAQDIIRQGKGQAFVNALGYGTTKILAETPNIDRYTYGVTIKAKPTQDELNFINEQISIAQQNGQITVDDVIFLDTFKNAKEKALFLAYRVKKNREIQQQQKAQLDQANSQGQAQAAQVAEQARQSTLQMEYDLKFKFMMAEKGEERKNLEVQGQYNLEKARIDSSGRVEASYVQAKERQDSNVRNNVTDLIKNDKGEEQSKIDIKDDLVSTVEPFTSATNPTLDIELPQEEADTPSFLHPQETPQQEQAEPTQESAQVEAAEPQQTEESEPQQEQIEPQQE